jgi:hypothetical protein
VIATGAVSHSARDRALMWVDTHIDLTQPEPIIVLVLTDADGSQTTLWLCSNKDFYEDPTTLPHNLRMNVERWIQIPRKPIVRVDRTIIVDPSGQEQKEVPRETLGVPFSRYGQPTQDGAEP